MRSAAVRKGLMWSGAALLLLLAGGLIAPFIRVDQYREQIREGLQRSLQRQVDIYGSTHLNLFQGPGFSVEKVVIHDHPSAGIEPLASVPELQTTVSLSSLWKGRLEFATVRFVEPSLNIVMPEHGPLNVAGLLAGAVPASKAGSEFPEIQVSGGRINFKFGNVKSAFYLTDTDLTVSPGRNGLDLRFSCAPARTDRTQQGYGLFSGRGVLANGNIDLGVQLERSPIEELVTLVRGQSLGLHGAVTSRATVKGPLMAPQITGRFDLEDVHRWDLIPGSSGNLSLAYRGSMDFAAQRFELTSTAGEGQQTPLSLRLTAAKILSQPEWVLESTVAKLPAKSLMDVARHMGAPVPEGLITGGETNGTISYGSQSGMSGLLTVSDVSLSLEPGTQFSMPQASIEISGDEVRLLPAELAGPDKSAQLAIRYAPFRQTLDAAITARNLRVSDLQNGRALSGLGLPLDNFRGGSWSGTVRYASEPGQPAKWSASLRLRDTTASVPGLSVPVKIASADVAVDGPRLSVERLQAAAGALELAGSYRYEPGVSRPHRFNLTLPAASLSEIEAVLAPSLQRTRPGFLARTLKWKTSLPAWLQERQAEGELRIANLDAGDYTLRGFHGKAIWSGPTIELHNVTARAAEGVLTGRLSMDLTGPAPQYRFTGDLRNVAWKRGLLDVDGSFAAAGTGAEVLASLKADGKFVARSLALAPDVAIRNLSGTFDMAGAQIRLSGLQAAAGTERFSGEGATQPDGLLQIDLASSSRVVRLSGPMAALHTEVTTERPGARQQQP